MIVFSWPNMLLTGNRIIDRATSRVFVLTPVCFDRNRHKIRVYIIILICFSAKIRYVLSDIKTVFVFTYITIKTRL